LSFLKRNSFFFFLLSLLIISCGEKKYSEEEATYIAEINNRRITTDDFFRKSESSPLPDSLKANFKGLEYYPVDPAWRIKGTYRPNPSETPFDMRYSKGGTYEFVIAGEITFSLNGKEYKLNAYREVAQAETEDYPGMLIVPFYDLTNKTETYPGGRFLDFFAGDGKEVYIDFNTAKNPFCVFNPSYDCPVPPIENLLEVEIKAGEKYHD